MASNDSGQAMGTAVDFAALRAAPDPFHMLRPGVDSTLNPKPTDQLSAEEYTDMEAGIAKCYLEHGRLSVFTDGRMTDPETVHFFKQNSKQISSLWVDIISRELMHDVKFQRLVIDDIAGPAQLALDKLELSGGWLIGLWLPGYYDRFRYSHDGVDTIQRIAARAIADAKTKLVDLVAKSGYSAIP